MRIRRRTWFQLLACLASLSVCRTWPGHAQETARRLTAKDLYAHQATVNRDHSLHQGSLGLKYRIGLLAADGAVSDVPSTRVFQPGDRIQVRFETNTSGYVYVFLEDATGQRKRIFPHPTNSGGQNYIQAFVEHTVPVGDQLRLDAGSGEQTLYFLVSPVRVAEYECIPYQLPILGHTWTRVTGAFAAKGKRGAEAFYADPGESSSDPASAACPVQYAVYVPTAEFPMLAHMVRLAYAKPK